MWIKQNIRMVGKEVHLWSTWKVNIYSIFTDGHRAKNLISTRSKQKSTTAEDITNGALHKPRKINLNNWEQIRWQGPLEEYHKLT